MAVAKDLDAWFAGVLDAKGQLIRRQREPSTLIIRLVDTNQTLLTKFRREFGGSLWTSTNDHTFEGARAIHRWEVRSAAAASMLQRLLPLCRVRRKEFAARLKETK